MVTNLRAYLGALRAADRVTPPRIAQRIYNPVNLASYRVAVTATHVTIHTALKVRVSELVGGPPP